MLGQDAFAWFEQHGGLTRANGQRYRDMVLSRGNTLDYAEMYRAFAGHDPDIQPYLDYYGLGGAGDTSAPTPPPPAATPSSSERGK
jgi:peptidyl-dipeptidase Dcp